MTIKRFVLASVLVGASACASQHSGGRTEVNKAPAATGDNAPSGTNIQGGQGGTQQPR